VVSIASPSTSLSLSADASRNYKRYQRDKLRITGVVSRGTTSSLPRIRRGVERKLLALVAFPARRRCPARREPIRKLERDRAENL